MSEKKRMTRSPATCNTQDDFEEEVLKLSGTMREIPLKVGVKYDNEKPRLALIPSSLLIEVGKVLTYGAKKYSAHNWRHGISQERLLSAALRHIVAYNEGENLDPESNLHHLAHAICELAFAMDQNLAMDGYMYKEFDDRFCSLHGENNGEI
jgi:hypothetical protein